MIGTSNVTSQFLEEIQRSETESLMQTVQELACGNDSARQNMLDAAEGGKILEKALHNLIHGYLPDLGQNELVRLIQDRVIQAQM